jgi:hypothetical protein
MEPPPPPSAALVVGSCAFLLVAFGAQGMLQEHLQSTLRFSSPDLFAALVPLSAFVGGVLAGGLARPRRAPLRAHLAIGLVLFASFRLTALVPLYLSFPALVAGKAAKLLPTMAVGSSWLRKRYSTRDWAAAALAAAGLALALAADSRIGGSGGGGGDGSTAAAAPLASAEAAQASAVGALLLLLALLLDGVASNAQELLFAQFAVPRSEIPCFSMGVAAVLSVAWGLAAGDLRAGVATGVRDARVAAALAGFTLASYACNVALLNMIALVGATPTAFVGAICRALMIAASFALFPKALARNQLLGMGAVFLGVGLSAMGGGGKAAAPEPLEHEIEPAAEASASASASAALASASGDAGGDTAHAEAADEGAGGLPPLILTPPREGDGGLRQRRGGAPLERLRMTPLLHRGEDDKSDDADTAELVAGGLAPAPTPAASSPLLPPSLLPRRESVQSSPAQTPRGRAAGAAAAAAGSGASAQPSPSPPQQRGVGGGAGVGVLLEAAAEGLLGLQRPPAALAEALSPLRRTASFAAAAATPRAATPKPPNS